MRFAFAGEIGFDGEQQKRGQQIAALCCLPQLADEVEDESDLESDQAGVGKLEALRQFIAAPFRLAGAPWQCRP